MEKVTLSKSAREALKLLEGKSLQEKLERSFIQTLENRLAQCNTEILKFETKYGLTFVEFARAWDAGQIPNQYSYEVESDYCDWEALDMEKKKLLKALLNLKAAK